jgi:Condensation domain
MASQIGRSGMSNSSEIGQDSRWLLRELGPGTPVHCIAATACFPGQPDIPALKHVLHELATRHAPLRATFPPGGDPAERSAMVAEACVRESDARDLDDERLVKWLEYAAQEPFDLARGPRLRIHVFWRTEDETIVLVVAHHFIADLWSMTTLVREFETLYAERAGHMPAVQPAPAPGDQELVRLYRWVGGTRVSVHAAQEHGAAGRPAAGRRRSGVALGPQPVVQPGVPASGATGAHRYR